MITLSVIKVFSWLNWIIHMFSSHQCQNFFHLKLRRTLAWRAGTTNTCSIYCPVLPDIGNMAIIISCCLAFLKIFWLRSSSVYSSHKISSSFPEPCRPTVSMRLSFSWHLLVEILNYTARQLSFIGQWVKITCKCKYYSSRATFLLQRESERCSVLVFSVFKSKQIS